MVKEGIIETPWFFTGDNMGGEGVQFSHRTLADLKGIFSDSAAFEAMNPSLEVYKVLSLEPQPGLPGALNMGITYLLPGKVGKEYFMTKGHFHQNPNSTEYYWGIQGCGILILMDESRHVWAESMKPGSLHYIPAGIAHRVANTGEQTLVFAAAWPSDAGHDYASIAKDGFAKRLLEIDGKPELI